MTQIKDIIDEKTYEQFDRLLDVLAKAKVEFIDTAKGAAAFTSELGKIDKYKDLDIGVKNLEKSIDKLDAAKAKTTKAAKDAAAAEDAVVKATKERIKVSSDEIASINKAGTSLDNYIRLQVRLKAESGQITKDQRELAKEFDKGALTADAYSDSLAEMSKRKAGLKTATEQVNAVVKAYSREANAAEGSSEQLSSRLVRLRREWDNLTESERENSETGRNLNASITELDTTVKGLDEQTGRSQRNVGNYKSAFEGLPGPIGEAVTSIQNISASTTDMAENLGNTKGGFATLISGLKAAAKAALAFIATPLGLTLVGISAALLAAKGWFEYNKGIAEATKLTKQLTGLSGNELKSLRAEVQATASSFGKEYKEVLIATNSVAKQFGISQAEALDVVNKGFIVGADVSGEFLDQLREYPAQLNAVGLSASETAAIIAQNVKSGIYSDKGVDTIKEAGLRLREMTPAAKEALTAIGLSSDEIQAGLADGTLSMFEAIQKVSNRLGELPANSAKVGTAIADIFGGPGEDAGLEYIKTLGSIELNLDAVVDASGELGRSQLEQLNATQELNKATAALFDSTDGFYTSLTNTIKLYATKALLGLVNGIIDVSNYFIDLYNNVMLFRAGIQTIKVTFQNLFDFIAFMFTRTFDAVKSFGALLKAVITGDLSGIKDAIAGGFSDQVEAFKKLGKDVGQNYIDGFNEVVNSTPVAKIDKNLDYATEILSGSGGGASEESETGSVTFRRIAAEIAGVERILDLNKKLEVDLKSGASRVAEWKARMAKQAADAEIAQQLRSLAMQEEVNEAKKELFAEVVNVAIALVNRQFEMELNSLKEQEEQIDINKAKEIDKINSSVASEEEKAAKISILEARAATEKEAIQRREAEVQRRQAEFEKAIAIGRIIANTAGGVTAALASVPPNIPLSVVIGAIGAAQIAKVALTPIPQYFTGIESSPEGFAKVGERGAEIRVEPSGEMSLTPGKETLTYLKEGTKIIPAHETKALLHNQKEDLEKYSKPGAFEVSSLNNTYRKGVTDIVKAINSKPTQHTNITREGFKWGVKMGKNWTKYLNRNI